MALEQGLPTYGQGPTHAPKGPLTRSNFGHHAHPGPEGATDKVQFWSEPDKFGLKGLSRGLLVNNISNFGHFARPGPKGATDKVQFWSEPDKFGPKGLPRGLLVNFEQF